MKLLTRKDETVHFTLNKTRYETIEFDGVKLADQNSRSSEFQGRWQEIRIYRTDQDVYITETVGRSVLPGESDRTTINYVPRSTDLAHSLERTKNGKAFLTDLALDALDELKRNDPEFNETEIL